MKNKTMSATRLGRMAHKNRNNVLAVQIFRRVMPVSSEHNFVQVDDDTFELVHVPTGAKYTFVRGTRTSPYLRTSVMLDGVKTTLYKHRLICEMFNGPAPKGHVVDHIDRDKRNNSTSNLRWVTLSENRYNTAMSDKATKKRQADRLRKLENIKRRSAKLMTALKVQEMYRQRLMQVAA